MWLFASAIIICITIVCMFFLMGKLLESKWRHERLMQNDRNLNEKYHAITNRPDPVPIPESARPAMPDFQKAVESERNKRKALKEIRALPKPSYHNPDIEKLYYESKYQQESRNGYR